SSIQSIIADLQNAPEAARFLTGVNTYLTQQLKDVVQQTLLVTAPTQQQATRKAVYEYDLASVLVGLSPGPVGYKFVLLATLPMAMDASEEAMIRGSIPALIRDITANSLPHPRILTPSLRSGRQDTRMTVRWR